MKRTGHFARHMALLLALLLLSALLLPACQPTPEEDIVVNKGDGALMELVLATAAPEQEQTARVPYSAPARYEEAFVGYSDNLSVEIDAEVIAPPEAPIPVYEAQPLEWTDAQADACICALIGDVTLYEQTSALSKAEVEALIVECQRELSDPNSDLNTILQFGGTQAEYEAGKANVEATLAALEQLSDVREVFARLTAMAGLEEGYLSTLVKVLGVIKSSVYLYLPSIVTLICSALILHEPMSRFSLLGAGLTLAGLVLSEWDSLRAMLRQRKAVPGEKSDDCNQPLSN